MRLHDDRLSRAGRDRTTVALPDGLVLIDGLCVLCSASFRFVAARDPACRFRFAAVQSGLGRRVATAIGIDPAAPESFAVIVAGRALLKSEGALHILSRLPGWRWTAAFRFVPRAARDWAYDRIARNRYAVFGRLATCMVPDAALRRHMAVDGAGA